MNLADPVAVIPGIGSVMASRLEKLEIYSVFDLLYYLPARYEDRGLVSEIAHVQSGEQVTVSGKMTQLKNVYTRHGKALQQGIIADSSGNLAVTWFNQPFLLKNLHSGQAVSLYGKAEFFGNKLTLVSPEYDTQSSSLHMGRLVAIYPETAGVSSKWLRSKISSALDNFTPIEYLADLATLKQLHFPESLAQAETARQHLAQDELFLLSLRNLRRRREWRKLQLAYPLPITLNESQQFIKTLPFKLTAGQYTAMHEILSDMSQDKPMNRLLEGDVGSGKTVVAAIAIYATHLHAKKSLLMAPTQLLANQHYVTLKHLLEPLGLKVGLATSASKKYDPQSDVVVGTSALLAKHFAMPKVALVVIDEQHRFGVTQRTLVASRNKAPHVLTMTATPIPRTVALALYGDLDLSVLAELPSGRLPIKTWVVPEEKRQPGYDWIKNQISNFKAQVFIVCPLIDESETLQAVKAVTSEFEKLKNTFANFNLGLLHGRLKAGEKNQVLEDFRLRKIDILVATPVVEVGIDIPAATIMLIEAADRFGLAQLHQLRGRVGRGQTQAYCLLFAENTSAKLLAMEKHQSGLELAEIDLKLRGEGNVFGTAQHGRSSLKIATYQDLTHLEAAKEKATEVLPKLEALPHLRILVEQDKIAQVSPN